MASAPQILTDADVAKLPMSTVVDCMERTLKRLVSGELVAPARLSTGELLPVVAAGDAHEGAAAAQDQLARSQRTHADGAGELVFTPGAVPGAIGFRVYDLVQLSSPRRAEIVAVLSTEDGSLSSLVMGPLLGAMRTGGIGGVALRHLVRASASVLALVGCGYQARTQLMAACAIGRTWSQVRVYARRREQAEQFVLEMMNLPIPLAGLPADGIMVNESVEAAVRGADVVICTTTATSPLIKTEWLSPGTHVTNVGPKFSDGAE
jgi:ornithine cyclodeaminase